VTTAAVLVCETSAAKRLISSTLALIFLYLMQQPHESVDKHGRTCHLSIRADSAESSSSTSASSPQCLLVKHSQWQQPKPVEVQTYIGCWRLTVIVQTSAKILADIPMLRARTLNPTRCRVAVGDLRRTGSGFFYILHSSFH
jgi:hypothetical protein